jgi:hypothetical protein
VNAPGLVIRINIKDSTVECRIAGGDDEEENALKERHRACIDVESTKVSMYELGKLSMIDA